MEDSENSLQPVDPARVLHEIAEAVPPDCRRHIILIGSLAAGYHYRDQLRGMAVRTKDADCLLCGDLALTYAFPAVSLTAQCSW